MSRTTLEKKASIKNGVGRMIFSRGSTAVKS